MNKIKDKINKFLSKTGERLSKTTTLEILGLIAISILILNLLFSFEITVNRKTFLNKIVGSLNGSKSAVSSTSKNQTASENSNQLGDIVLPTQGITLPITWGNLGKKLVKSGIIDNQKIEALYNRRGGMTPKMKTLLYEDNDDKIIINAKNSGFFLNLWWALGLANKNPILETGEMTNPKYGGNPSRFASTGGWSLTKGNTMDYYSKFALLSLTPEEQAMVERVSKNIYRPCCNNSTHFPDCNHGMAMLGFLELMASQGINEQDMYKYALVVNSYWFPDTYLTVAKYLETQNQDFQTADPKTLLSAEYSSSQGYRQILNQVQPVKPKSGADCGV